MPRAARLIQRVCVLLSFSLLLNAVPLLAQERDPKLVELAQVLAGDIEKNSTPWPSLRHTDTVLAFDFAESSGEVTQLGIHLADELSEAMRTKAPGLTVLDRASLRDLISKDRLDPAYFQQDSVAFWAAKSLGANVSIVGRIYADPDFITVTMHMFSGDPQKRIGVESKQLDWTPERHTWQAQSAKLLPPDLPWKDVPKWSSIHGHPELVCMYCPAPPYTDDARKARAQGKIMTRVLVGEDGLVQDAAVLQGLPFGLNAAAIEAVKKWRYKPLTGPDGKPMQVQVDIEMSFSVT